MFFQPERITTSNIHPKSINTCSRCSGSGFIRVYKHIENGRCFRCNGSGKVHLSHSVDILPKSHRRWYIGFLNNGNGSEQLFSFSSDNLKIAKTRVDKELVLLGIKTQLTSGNFNLVIGDVGKKKDEVLAEFHESKINN